MSGFDGAKVVSLLDTCAGAPRRAVDAIQTLGLRALLTADPISVSQISEQSGLAMDEVLAGVQGLVAAGRLEIEAEVVVGVGGLTLSETTHTLAAPEATIHTWCALDAIGVPAALGIDADVSTGCAHCGKRLHVHLENGLPTADGPVRLLCPTGPCTDVRADFCSSANLFCGLDHVLEWRASNPSIEAEVLDLEETADLGRAMWGPRF